MTDTKCKRKDNMKEFILQTKRFGLKVAVGNWLIVFTKWFIGAKRMVITYKK